jgi:hypothetical protein
MPFNSGDLRRALVMSADLLAKTMRSKAKTTRMRGAISVGQVEEGKDYLAIEITTDLTKAPEAAAYEYGSGIHATKRSPSTYPIRKDKSPFIAFVWDKVDPQSKKGKKFRGISNTTGKAIFTYVDHPGVAAVPFIAPSLEEKTPEIVAILGQAFRAEIFMRIREVANASK